MQNGTWCCLDIGGMTTEVSIWANGQVLSQETLEIGGDHFTKQVLSVTKKKYQAEIGWLTAEQIKKNLLCLAGAKHVEEEVDATTSVMTSKSRRVKVKEEAKVASSPNGSKFTVRARSSTTDLPTTIVLAAANYVAPLEEVAQELVWLVKEAMQDLSPELLSTALENGILLTGGGALLPGLVQYLEKQLQTSVLLSHHPREDVIRGL
jgi:rod shape-determining protein MreB